MLSEVEVGTIPEPLRPKVIEVPLPPLPESAHKLGSRSLLQIQRKLGDLESLRGQENAERDQRMFEVPN